MNITDDPGNNSPDADLDIVAAMSASVMDDILTPLTNWLDQDDTLPIGVKFALRLILEELLANTVMHGAVPPGSDIRLQISALPEGVQIRFQDSGVAFNPETDLPHDSREDNLDDRPVGQLGWPLILHYCSISLYERFDEQNRLTLLFRFNV